MSFSIQGGPGNNSLINRMGYWFTGPRPYELFNALKKGGYTISVHDNSTGKTEELDFSDVEVMQPGVPGGVGSLSAGATSNKAVLAKLESAGLSRTEAQEVLSVIYEDFSTESGHSGITITTE